MVRIRARWETLALAAAVAFAGGVAFVMAGPLDPPAGPVAPTNKTLSEVEPRIAINFANTPGDSDSLYKITQPGSYYLTGNITGVSGKRGIEVASSGVTVDLNGFTLQGVTGGLEGIKSNGVDLTGISLRNGVVRGWPLDGVNIGSGPVFAGCVDGVVAEANGGDGLQLGNQIAITRCSSINNVGYGFLAASTCTFTNCSARGNGIDGFYCTVSGTFNNCAAYLNTGNGFLSTFDTAAYDNCTSGYNVGDGFHLASSASVTACVSANNKGSGFLISTHSTISGCTAYSNAIGAATGGNIRVTGADNHVVGNNCTSGLRGIQIVSTGNFISKNVCSGNTTNWDVVSGNVCLVVSATTAGAISGNSGGAAPGSTDPNANFTY